MNTKYRVPSMAEIENIEPNGFKVVSTFSGGGGSCLGYRMAGFEVVWANEFVEEAQKTYRANHKDTFLNTQDIRTVSAKQIMSEAKIEKGQIDLFDGSPPCSAFSTAGKREKIWGKEKAYSDTVQRVDDLFFEYTRLLYELQPKTFIAENVSGLVKGKARGYFKEILKRMEESGYVVSARLINAKNLGVPQSRERIIFYGIRKDLNAIPEFPKPQRQIITLKDALEGVENDEEEVKALLEEIEKHNYGKVLKKLPKNPKKAIKGSKIMNGSYFNLSRESFYEPCSTICQANGRHSASGNCHPTEDRKFTIAEVKRIMSVPDDFILTGSYTEQWERLGRMVPPVMMKHIAESVAETLKTL